MSDKCGVVLETIENKVRMSHNVVERAHIYIDGSVNLPNFWTWLKPGDEFQDIGDSAADLYLCDAFVLDGVFADTRDEKRELIDAEKKFVQALHFNPLIQRFHDCDLTYRDACYFGVDKVWCESHGVDANEMDGTDVLRTLRHLFAKPSYTNMNDDTLLYLRELYADPHTHVASFD
jgi:hypothetical protein